MTGTIATQSPESNRKTLHDGEESEDSGSDEDYDLDPDDYVNRYIQLQRRLYKRTPELTQVEIRGGKKFKGKPFSLPKSNDPKSIKILQKIREIEKDILFDKEEAAYKWSEIRLGLIIEDAERKKYFGEQCATTIGTPKSKREVFVEAESLISVGDDDSDVGIGEFFSALPEHTVDETTGATSMSTKSGGQVLAIRDFGKVAGMAPRRVLEEACKSR